ncbi:uncharacterized protein TNCV_4956431 [Trichonephila clavipes]|nr:uncharacterized protein TNCV_4956431 [Trichonephila clavipes]
MASNYKEMMKAKGFLPYHLDTLPDKFIQIAKEELGGETNEIRGPALEQFRKRILANDFPIGLNLPQKLSLSHTDYEQVDVFPTRDFSIGSRPPCTVITPPGGVPYSLRNTVVKYLPCMLICPPAQKKTHILHFDFDLLSISFSRSSTRHAIVTPDKLIFDMAGASDRQSTSIASPSFINSPSAKAFHN